MSTYVLVPGAWLGGWSWRYVTGDLVARGHDVHPVTLTGVGERVHLGGPGVGLDTHITDVVNAIEYGDLADVVLVGHSYSGIVITGVADRVGDRLAAQVFVESAPFPDGMTFVGISPPEEQERMRQHVKESGEGWRLPFPSIEALGKDTSLAGLDEGALALMRAKATDQPFGTYTEPLALTGGAAGSYERVVIVCDDMRSLLEAGVPGVDEVTGPGWRRFDLATGHWPMLSTPTELADVLDQVPRS